MNVFKSQQVRLFSRIIILMYASCLVAQDDAGCLQVIEPKVICNTEGDGVTLQFDILNQLGFDAYYVVIEAPDGVLFANNSETQVLNLNESQPLANQQMRHFEIELTQVTLGGELCIYISLHNENREECCTRLVCFNIPDCDCLQVADTSLNCNSDGTIDLVVNITNLSDNKAYSAWVTGPAGVSMAPNSGLIPLSSPLDPGDSTTLSLTMSGASAGDVCLLVSLHTDHLALCCSVQDVCVVVPDCMTCNLAPGDCQARMPYQAARFDALNGPVAAVTCWAELDTDHVFGLVDISGQPSSGLWSPPMYHNEMPNLTNCEADVWNKKNLGNIFGLTIDGDGNTYVTATSSYLIDNFTTHGSGAIFKIDGVSGAISLFAQLDQSKAQAGLGNISYGIPGVTEVLYVTNFADGKIHALDLSGNPITTPFDPFGASDVDDNGWADLGQRLWGVEYHNNRVYFSVWKVNSSTPSTQVNQIYSVAVNASGHFVGSERWELDMPDFRPGWSSPVSDLSFAPDGRLLTAERGMRDQTNPYPHHARVIEWICEGGLWLQNSNYQIGYPNGSKMWNSAAGGVDVIYPPFGEDHSLWVTADFMFLSGTYAYGLQGMQPYESYPDSLRVELDGDFSTRDKNTIGDVEIPCLPAVPPTITDIAVKEIGSGNGGVFIRGTQYSLPLQFTNTSTIPTPAVVHNWDLCSAETGERLDGGVFTTGELASGLSQTIEFTLELHDGYPLGGLDLTIRVNPEREVPERSYDNNTIRRTIFLVE